MLAFEDIRKRTSRPNRSQIIVRTSFRPIAVRRIEVKVLSISRLSEIRSGFGVEVII